MIKVIELFASIGAQRQVLKEAKIEHEVVAISEIDKYAISAYSNELIEIKVEGKKGKSNGMKKFVGSLSIAQ